MAQTEEVKSINTNGVIQEWDQTSKETQNEITNDRLQLDPPTEDKAMEMRKRMEAWLNQPMRIRMSDGRTLVGTFICTDKDRNVILGSCEEYVTPPDSPEKEEPRVLGLAMVPGQHIVTIEIDDSTSSSVPL